MQNYYSKKIFIPTVTKSGRITGKIERWEAHEKGILHKAFSVVVLNQGHIYLQIRKHPVFDRVVDVTASSHPEMHDGKTEDEKDSVIRCLKREWNVTVLKDNIKDIGSIYYKSKDKNSNFIEHEYCTFYRAEIGKMIIPDPDVSYGYLLVDLEHLKKHSKNFNLAPWVNEALRSKLL